MMNNWTDSIQFNVPDEPNVADSWVPGKNLFCREKGHFWELSKKNTNHFKFPTGNFKFLTTLITTNYIQFNEPNALGCKMCHLFAKKHLFPIQNKLFPGTSESATLGSSGTLNTTNIILFNEPNVLGCRRDSSMRFFVLSYFGSFWVISMVFWQAIEMSRF